MKREEIRSPLDRAQPLRVAGQSLDEAIDKLLDDHALTPYMLATLLVIMAGFEWWRYVYNVKPNPILFTIAAVLAVTFAVFKIVRTRKRALQLRLGRDGERVVAEHLEELRKQDFVVFHDVPSGDANVDHLVVGPKGVFTIETKTRSKPLRGACKVTVKGGEIFANGRKLDRNPLDQAKGQARWAGNFLRKSGFEPFVWPAVVFPGWFVEPFDDQAEGIWVLEAKALAKFIENEPVRHSMDEVRAMAAAVRSHVRAQLALKQTL